MKKNSLPIDIDHELEEFNNDVTFFKDLIDEFLVHVEKSIPVMEKAVADNDGEILKNEAHAIKGGAANLAANDLSKIACELEEICESGILKNSLKSVEKLKNEFLRLKEYVQHNDTLNL
ncbi:MAG: Hpt domain-containing protein [Desulfobacteraceae bacterium]|nr:Hpt domain-containing protein [Desulfobacteraceae bacterium]